MLLIVLLSLANSVAITSCKKVDNLPIDGSYSNKKTSTLAFSGFNIEDVFKSIDIDTLKSVAENNDSALITQELIELASEIQLFLKTNYDSTFNPDIVTYYKEIIVLGISYLKYQQEIAADSIGNLINSENTAVIQSGDLDCILSAVGGLIGVSDVISLVNSFKNGISATTLLGTAKVMLKRTAAAITVAIVIYQMGECFGWW